MKKVLICFTCMYSALLLLSTWHSTAQVDLDASGSDNWSIIPYSVQPRGTNQIFAQPSSQQVSVPKAPAQGRQPVATVKAPSVAPPIAHPKKEAPHAKKMSPADGSFVLTNKTGVYTTATPRTISIQGVTLNPIFSKQKGSDTTNQIINDLKNKAISSDDGNPTTVARGVVGFQFKIGNKIYLASLHGIPQNAALEIVDRGNGYVIQSAKDAVVKIKPIALRFSKGQTQILKTGIDIPDLPPEIFSIRGMKLPGLNPLSE